MDFSYLTLKNEYRSKQDNVVREFYIPVLQIATRYDRAVGFFSSTSLAFIAEGLLSFVNNGGKIRLIASPRLSEEDIDAIQKGYKLRDRVLLEAVEKYLYQPKDFVEKKRLNLLANLIKDKILDIKLAVVGSFGMYHEKMGIFIDESGKRIAFSGSMNESVTALNYNYETIDVFCDWKNEVDKKRADEKERAFNRIWNAEDSNISVLDSALIENTIINKYLYENIDYQSVDKSIYEYNEVTSENVLYVNGLPCVPDGKKLDDFLYKYQLDAINKWQDNGCVGIYDMATGTGKTFTALGSVYSLCEKLNNNLAVFIVCPYIHLVSQWEEDVVLWGMKPIIAHSQSPDSKWKNTLLRRYKTFRKYNKFFVCITTNDTFGSGVITEIINDIRDDMNVLLVVDEAHNFGAEKLSRLLSERFKYRLALSATIERHMDNEGTQRLFDFFGERCIEYSLKEAIDQGFLVHYDYFPVCVFLTNGELSNYQKLTRQLIKCLRFDDGDAVLTEEGKLVLFKRSRLLAGAVNKIDLLKELLSHYVSEKYILVYCGATNVGDDKDQKQIDVVTEMIQNDLGMNAHKFTSEENLNQREMIKDCFSSGIYQVITAIRCLDEGVNIPDIKMAFIMSSSRNPKEFIQRRGRLLRKSNNKRKAIIYDFITLPRQFEDVAFSSYEEDKSIILGELARIYEFGKLADNKMEADKLIDRIQSVYGVDIDLENEIWEEEKNYE